MPPLELDALEELNSSASSFGSTESAGRGDNNNVDTNSNSSSNRNSNNNSNNRPAIVRSSEHARRNLKRCRRSVHFSSSVIVQETLHVKNFTKDEHESYWVTKREFDLIGEIHDMTLQLMAMGTPETDMVCYRGMHDRTKTGKQQYRQLRKRTLLTLLQEQNVQRRRHREKGGQAVLDDHAFSVACSVHTAASQEAALQRAHQDALDAQSYLTSSS
jgi:hypothetical protein